MNEPKKKYDLYIIIVSWNTKDLLKKCLHSVFTTLENLTFKVIVLDNASTDGSVEMIKDIYPEVILIENEENVGFAKANNQAFKLIGNCKYILLLNSDAILVNKVLQQMVEFLENNQKAGIVAPALCFPNRKFQMGGGFGPSLITAFNYFLFLSILLPKTFKGLFINQRKLKKAGDPVRIDWVAGTCMLVRKEVIEEVGGMDDSYFMYAEDTEWCERTRNAGWEIYYLPYLEIIHYHGASSKTVSDQWIKSLILYMKIKTGITKSIFFRLIAAIGFGLRSVFYLLGFITTNKKEWIRKAYRMYIFFKGALS